MKSDSTVDMFPCDPPLGNQSGCTPLFERSEFHKLVVGVYHELLPSLPRIKVWTAARAGALNARIRERRAAGKPSETIEYWRQFFTHVSESPFLMGQRTDFRADLPWLLRPENFAKTIEGKYHTGGKGQWNNHGR
ncbi:MAG TPA: hypothetical protein VMF03_03120 [Steroidobacteraceae bacterium]|nr:hypothetical protein [Steroidobacteraceae bacterium]